VMLVKELLNSIEAISPIFPSDTGKIFKVFSTDTISDAIQVMIEGKVQCVPVLDQHSGLALCMLSFMDIMGHILTIFTEDELKDDFHLLERKAEELRQRTVIDIKEIGKLDPILCITQGAPLMEIVEAMIVIKAHRAMIRSPEGMLINIISQSRIIQMITSILPKLEVSYRTMEVLKIGTAGVISISQNELTIRAFKLMKENKISAVAVVNVNGCLVGSVSATDLKECRQDMALFSRLGKPVKTFLLKIHKHNPTRPSVIKCTGKTTLKEVIGMVMQYKIHRVYMVDDSDKPIAVISLHDILSFLLKY